MVFHSKKAEEAVKELSSDLQKGLTESQVIEKRKQYGENKLREKKKKTNLQRFIDQFKDVMIIILLIALLYPL